MKEMNNIPFPKEKANKVNYMWRDIERRAKFYGFQAKVPAPYPLKEFDLANQIAILVFNISFQLPRSDQGISNLIALICFVFSKIA